MTRHLVNALTLALTALAVAGCAVWLTFKGDTHD
jgi:hypothetical protein